MGRGRDLSQYRSASGRDPACSPAGRFGRIRRPAGADGHRLAAVAGGFAGLVPASLVAAVGTLAEVPGILAFGVPSFLGLVGAVGLVATGLDVLGLAPWGFS